MEKNKNLGFGTRTIHSGYENNEHGSLVSPIHQTSTFIFDNAEQGGRRFSGEEEGFIYGRLGNPTSIEAEKKITDLEGGEAAAATASGMGAITSAIWSTIESGDHIVASKTLYGCTFAYLNHGLKGMGIDITFVDTSDPKNVEEAMQENTTLVYLETPANPTLALTDIEEIAKIGHANEDCTVMIDNTFNTPFITRPLSLGADVVVHSATKYLNGHGDVLAGFVVGSEEFIGKVKTFGIKDMTGAVLSPFDAFLLNRGMKTLEIRMEKHVANAKKVAEFLEGHEAVEKIYYPGLESFPQYELAQKQMDAPGAIIAFEVKGGIEAGKKVLDTVELAALAVSLGDAETLIQHPASMTHSPYTKEERAESGIAEGLVRLSVGLETADDIIADLKQALDAIV